jgi:predicted nucleic acid-binding protein
MVAPDLLYLEVTSALRKLVGRGELEARAASRAVTLLGQLPIRGLATQPLLVDIWAWRDSLTPYDAAYAALAKSTGLPLVTADAGLATAARRRSIRAVTLEDLSG